MLSFVDIKLCLPQQAYGKIRSLSLGNRVRGDVLFGLREKKHMEIGDKLHN
jgi:hypothetical protein